MITLDDFAILVDGVWSTNTRKTTLSLGWSAIGGSAVARWDEAGHPDDLWRWGNLLGKGIEVYDPFTDRIWEGFIHGVQMQIEGRDLAFSLDGMVNRIAVMFSYVRYLCPVTGNFEINGTPSGNTLQYDNGAGGDPDGESDLVGLNGGTMLYNTTREEQATVQSVDGGTNTITLTSAVPGTWADNDDLLYGTVMGRELTGWVGNTDSQSRYGVKERLVSQSGMTTATAEAQRDALLELWAWPLGEIGRGGGSQRGIRQQDRVTVEALGWWARCTWRLWHWTQRGELSAADQAKLIRSEKLDFLSADESLIEDIGHSLTQYREDYNDAQKELLALAEMGVESTQQRVLVGVERGKQLYLRAADTTERYVRRSGERWYNSARQRLEPWRVRPDGYVLNEDLVPATAILGGVADPSRFYLEKVEWQWPDVVQATPLGGRDLETLINQGIRV
jgi:hypothetical protein